MNYKKFVIGAGGIILLAIMGNAIYQSDYRIKSAPDAESIPAIVQTSPPKPAPTTSVTEIFSNIIPEGTSDAHKPLNRSERTQRSGSMVDSPVTKRPAPSTPLRDQEAADAELQSHLNALNNEFISQATDEQWSAQSSDQIYGYFNQMHQQQTGSHAELRSVECRSSLCRVEVVHDDAASADDFFMKFPQELSDYLPSITYKIENLPDGKVDVLMYLASASINDQ